MMIKETGRKMTLSRFSEFFVLVAVFVLFSCQLGYSQTTHSPNTFSPYTMYGIGDCLSQATASQRAMGGVGVAMRPNAYIGPAGVHMELNYMNPASIAFIPQKTALFSFGAIFRGYYAKGWGYNYSGDLVPAKGARNSASMNDIGFAVPISRSLSLGLSLTPTTVVGYRVTGIGSEEEISESVGRALYTYTGEGGVSEFKASLAGRLTKNFSIGASVGYYFGNISKTYQATMSDLINPTASYRFIEGVEETHISEIFFDAGFIYTFRLSKQGYLNIGGTFRTLSMMDSPVSKAAYTTNGSTSVDTVSTTSYSETLTIPWKASGGIFYNDSKISIGLDYDYQDFKGAFDTNEETSGYTLSTQSQVRFGFAYTPNQFDMYETFKRLTYKAGVKYGSTYLVKDGYQMNCGSVTLGVDIPLKRGTLNKVSVALEVGMRGKYTEGRIKESYFKVNAGFSFFGEDMWFHRRKFY